MATTKVTNDMLVGPLGSGGGSINLIENGDADGASATIFTAYKDVGSRPTDGTGGAPAVSSSITTTTPLTGTKSYLLTKPAASSHQGEGWSLPSTPIDPSYRAKSLKISFDYIVEAGTFVAGTSTTDGDIIWTCYDETNSKIVEPSNIKMFTSSTTISGQFQATVQFDSNCTSFRLLGHMASASTQLIQIKVDNITVSPQNYVFGTPITDWQPYTPTINGAGTPTAVNFVWRRVGDSLQVLGSFISGTPTAATAEFSMPAGLTANGSVISTYTYYGDWIRVVSTGSTRKRGKLIVGAGSNNIGLVSDDYTTALGPASALAANTAFSVSDSVKISAFNIPITGWGASTQMSDSFDGRVILSTAQMAASSTTTNGGIVQFNTITSDKTGSITTGASWKYTVVTAGDYRASISMDVNIACNYQVYLNGISQGYILSAPLSLYGYGQRILPNLKAGDYIHFVSDTGGTVQAASYVTIEKIQGPQAIAASEPITCSYASSAGGSIAIGDTLQSFATKVYDSHGTWSGTVFTAPIVGKYGVSVTILTAAVVLATNQGILINVYKNGSLFRRVANMVGTGANNSIGLNGSTTVDLLAGETLSVYAASSVATSQFTNAAFNFLTIEKVG